MFQGGSSMQLKIPEERRAQVLYMRPSAKVSSCKILPRKIPHQNNII